MKNFNGLIYMDYPDKPYCIYTITSLDENDKSIYIGTTADRCQRVYRHSINRKYKRHLKWSLYKWMNDVIDNKKLNVIFKVIEEGYSEDEGFKREIELIKEYKKLGYIVLNDSDGGKGPTGLTPWNKGKKLSEEICQKFSDSHKGQVPFIVGKHHSSETKELIVLRNKERKERGWYNPRKKKVYKYDIDGNLISRYSCLKEAGIDNNASAASIGEWCRGNSSPKKNNYIWSYNLIK